MYTQDGPEVSYFLHFLLQNVFDMQMNTGRSGRFRFIQMSKVSSEFVMSETTDVNSALPQIYVYLSRAFIIKCMPLNF